MNVISKTARKRKREKKLIRCKNKLWQEEKSERVKKKTDIQVEKINYGTKKKGRNKKVLKNGLIKWEI